MSSIKAALDCGYLDGRVDVDSRISGRIFARWFVLRNVQRVPPRMASKCNVRGKRVVAG